MEKTREFRGAWVATVANIDWPSKPGLSTWDQQRELLAILDRAASLKLNAIVFQIRPGADAFYDDIYRDLRIPYEPVRWAKDRAQTGEDARAREARVLQMINAYRVRGHLLADIDPLEYTVRRHPELDPAFYGLTIWDLDRQFICGGPRWGKNQHFVVRKTSQEFCRGLQALID